MRFFPVRASARLGCGLRGKLVTQVRGYTDGAVFSAAAAKPLPGLLHPGVATAGLQSARSRGPRGARWFSSPRVKTVTPAARRGNPWAIAAPLGTV